MSAPTSRKPSEPPTSTSSKPSTTRRWPSGTSNTTDNISSAAQLETPSPSSTATASSSSPVARKPSKTTSTTESPFPFRRTGAGFRGSLLRREWIGQYHPVIVGIDQTLRSSAAPATAAFNLAPSPSATGQSPNPIDLSGASSVGDVVNLINQAAVGGITASITGQGLTLSGAAADNITVSGSTAQELGIATPPAGAGLGTPVAGSSLNPKVTLLTPLGSLNNGTGINNSGLTITNGQITKTVTWSPTGTVQDMLNAINGAGLGVSHRSIRSATGINILNASQGTSLSIGENGGTTAADLGIQTMALTTPLSQSQQRRRASRPPAERLPIFRSPPAMGRLSRSPSVPRSPCRT